MIRPFSFLLIASTLLFTFLTSCIERNNPFDPLLFSPDQRLDSLDIIAIRDSTSYFLDSLSRLAHAYRPDIDSISIIIDIDSAAVDSVLAINDSLREHNEYLRQSNAEIQIHNDSVIFVDSLRFKTQLDSLHHLLVRGNSSLLQQTHNQVQLLSALTALHIDSINAAHSPDTIYTPAMTDSIFQPYDSITMRIAALIEKVDSLAQNIQALNEEEIFPYNDTIATENLEIVSYNKRIQHRQQYERYEPISDIDSLENGFNGAGPGDIFVIGSGSFSPFLKTFNSGTEQDPIIMQGQPDMSTIFTSPEVILSNNRHFIFRNIVFRDSDLDGVRLENNSGFVVFDKCYFENNSTNGLTIIDSDVRVSNCRILNNRGRGIFTSSDQGNNNSVFIYNSLIAHNDWSGIEIIAATNFSVSNSTVSDNGLQGISIGGSGISLQINNSIISFNMNGIWYDYPFHESNLFTLGATIIYGNDDQAIQGPGIVNPDYINDVSPDFFDRHNEDYRILPSSELLELQERGVTIGYRPL
ncbi:MAG: right-handed parallel beta-helix repeat-containing protein [Chitinispirillaceae bacterium]